MVTPCFCLERLPSGALQLWAQGLLGGLPPQSLGQAHLSQASPPASPSGLVPEALRSPQPPVCGLQAVSYSVDSPRPPSRSFRFLPMPHRQPTMSLCNRSFVSIRHGSLPSV